MSLAVLAASAERRPPAQWKMNFLSSWKRERAGDLALALDLAGIADVDDHDVRILRRLDGVGGADGFDLGVGLVDHGLDAAVDGLGH
jgi:hypothetical protein